MNPAKACRRHGNCSPHQERSIPLPSIQYFSLYIYKYIIKCLRALLAIWGGKMAHARGSSPRARRHFSINFPSSPRRVTPSFFIALARWRLTVVTEIFRCWAMSGLLQPRAASVHTANSVVVRSSARRGLSPGCELCATPQRSGR